MASLIIVMVLVGTASAILSVHRFQRQWESLYLADNDLRTASSMISNDVHHGVAVSTYDPPPTSSFCSDFGLNNEHLERGLSVFKGPLTEGVNYLIVSGGSTGMAKLVRGSDEVDVFTGLDPDCSGFLRGDELPGNDGYRNGVWVYLKFKASSDRVFVRPLSFFLFPGG